MRRNYQNDNEKTIQQEITIADDVFVGAHTSILKGVSIGKNSIIGACSVVTKNIPANEMWAGNPARFIRKINKKNYDQGSVDL
jgi:acetyltransferase-like isoleucine patch superfamily enzyme